MSAEHTGDFNLVENPWARVQFLNGEIKDLSLREVFELSPQIRRLAHDNALIDTSVLAILEAIFIRAIMLSFEDLDELPTASQWLKKMMGAPAANLQLIFDYLDQPKIKNRFNLFDSEVPFMQVADLRTQKGEFSPVSRIIFDAESDYFSVRAGAGKEFLTSAEASQRLITAHLYDYSGIKSGALGDPRVKRGKGYPIGTGWFGNTGKVILHGDSLWETLLLNLPVKEVFSEDDEAPEDLPVWEREPDTAEPRNLEITIPSGPCDVLTWQTRRIRLIPESDGQVRQVLVSNGDKISDRFIDGANRFDPWTGYRFSKNQSSKTEKVYMPLHHSADATVWRGAEALVTLRGGSDQTEYANYKPETVSQMGRYFKDKKVNVQLIGVVYGTQNSVIETTIDESLTMELALISDEKHSVQDVVLESIRKALDAATVLGQYAGNLLVAAGKEYEFQVSAKESLLNKLETAFRIWLANVSTSQDAEELSKKWQLQAHNIIWQEAETLAQGAGQKAITGRLDENGRLINTATAQFIVRKKLKELFPYAYNSHEKEDAS